MKPSFFARRSFTILLVVTFLLSFIWAGTRRSLLKNQNDVTKWLPEGMQETEDHRWFQKHFPHEQFVLMSWEGCTLNDKDSRLQMLTKKLMPKPGEVATEENPLYFKSVITGSTLLDELLTRYPDLSRDEAIKRLKGSLIGTKLGDDDYNTCLVVTLNDTYRGKELQAVLEKIRSTAKECAVDADEIRLGGPPVDNAAIDYEGQRTLIRLAVLSLIVGLGISWFCFRSIRLTYIVFSCALLSAGTAMAIVYFTDGIVDAILLTMPSLVYVLAISGAIHIVNYYHDAVREGGLHAAPDRALGHGWKPCTIATITTAIGLGSLLASGLVPIRNFGLYSALGVLATLGMIFLLLPALLHYYGKMGQLMRGFVVRVVRAPALIRYADARVAATPGAGGGNGNAAKDLGDTIFLRFWRRMGHFVTRHNGLVTVGCLLMMGFFVLGITGSKRLGIPQIQTSVKLMKLFSPEAEIIGHYTWLEERLGPLVPMEVVVRVDNEKCQLSMVDRMRLTMDVEAVVESLDDVGGALSAATYAPQVQRRGRGGIFGPLEDAETNRILEAHRHEMAEFLAVDKEANEELWRVSARVEALGDLDYGEFVDEIKAKVDPVIAAYKAHGIDGISVTYTGLVPLIYKAQHQLLAGLFDSLKLAFVLIAIVMILVLRSVSAGLLAMIPNAFPVVIIFGMMSWLGILVDVGSMMTASVALGVAVDDTIHYLTWFRKGLDDGLDRKGAVMWAYERCATAMSQTTIIGGLGLAMFAFSTFTPTQRFGYLMLTLLAAALVGDLIFLPAVLSSPIGRFFRTRRKPPKSRDRQTPDETTQQVLDDAFQSEPSTETDATARRGTPVIHGPHHSPARRSTPTR